MAKKKKGEQMTWDEMVSRFDSEWVMINNPKKNKYGNVVGGEVVYHGRDQNAGYAKAKELKLKRTAMFYTGDLVPKGMEVLL